MGLGSLQAHCLDDPHLGIIINVSRSLLVQVSEAIMTNPYTPKILKTSEQGVVTTVLCGSHSLL
jgi:hypothetical protein